jgi:hypothetical protein
MFQVRLSPELSRGTLGQGPLSELGALCVPEGLGLRRKKGSRVDGEGLTKVVDVAEIKVPVVILSSNEFHSESKSIQPWGQ